MADAYKRQPARKARIGDVLSATYVRLDDGTSPSYAQLPDGRQAVRVDIIGVVIDTSGASDDNKNIVVEDGSGAIVVRDFEGKLGMEYMILGCVVHVIGRVSTFNDSLFISADFAKILKDGAWLEVRKKECALQANQIKKSVQDTPPPVAPEPRQRLAPLTPTSEKSPYERVYEYIKQQDRGDGVSVEDILVKVKIEHPEQVMEDLKREGEIFEIRPGKVKIL